jgi:hypothetical protein
MLSHVFSPPTHYNNIEWLLSQLGMALEADYKASLDRSRLLRLQNYRFSPVFIQIFSCPATFLDLYYNSLKELLSLLSFI